MKLALYVRDQDANSQELGIYDTETETWSTEEAERRAKFIIPASWSVEDWPTRLRGTRASIQVMEEDNGDQG